MEKNHEVEFPNQNNEVNAVIQYKGYCCRRCSDLSIQPGVYYNYIPLKGTCGCNIFYYHLSGKRTNLIKIHKFLKNKKVIIENKIAETLALY